MSPKRVVPKSVRGQCRGRSSRQGRSSLGGSMCFGDPRGDHRAHLCIPSPRYFPGLVAIARRLDDVPAVRLGCRIATRGRDIRLPGPTLRLGAGWRPLTIALLGEAFPLSTARAIWRTCPARARSGIVARTSSTRDETRKPIRRSGGCGEPRRDKVRALDDARLDATKRGARCLSERFGTARQSVGASASLAVSLSSDRMAFSDLQRRFATIRRFPAWRRPRAEGSARGILRAPTSRTSSRHRVAVTKPPTRIPGRVP